MLANCSFFLSKTPSHPACFISDFSFWLFFVLPTNIKPTKDFKDKHRQFDLVSLQFFSLFELWIFFLLFISSHFYGTGYRWLWKHAEVSIHYRGSQGNTHTHTHNTGTTLNRLLHLFRSPFYFSKPLRQNHHLRHQFGRRASFFWRVSLFLSLNESGVTTMLWRWTVPPKKSVL